MDPKTGKSAMGQAVALHQAMLVEEGHERINGFLVPEASQAWKDLKAAGVVANRTDAINQGILLLRDTRLSNGKKRRTPSK